MDGNKMKNKKLLAVLLFAPIVGFGAIDDLKEERMKILADAGLALPDSGIKLVPRSMLNLTEEELKKGDLAKEQIKNQGYANEETSRPMELLNFKSHAESEYKNNEGNIRNSSTHIRHSIQDLKLGFIFKGVPAGLMRNYIGVVPQGGFHKEGWSGAVQFFDHKTIGTCTYSVMNIKVSHGGVQLAIEDVTYDVNNKATLLQTFGSKSSGFIYKVKWYDNQNFHELECANMKYSADTNNSVIALANQIDTYQ
jgi:hypothetical protein